MKFMKDPLHQDQRLLPSIIYADGKLAIQFEKETVIEGRSGRPVTHFSYETNDPKKIKLIEAEEARVSEEATKRAREHLKKRKARRECKGNPAAINIKCEYTRIASAKPAPAPAAPKKED